MRQFELKIDGVKYTPVPNSVFAISIKWINFASFINVY